MKFAIVQVTQDRPVYYLLHDALRTLCYTLEDLGHDVIVQRNSLSRDRINIIAIGNRFSLSEINALIKQKIPYVVYQTEVFSSLGLNYVTRLSTEFCLDRQRRYLLLLKHATMIWECFDFNQAYLKKLGIESHLIYHGYIPELEGRKKKKELDVDVCFFGSLTEYRKTVLKQLVKKGISVKVLYVEPPFMRDDLLRRSKINLSIRANTNNMSHLPHFRILTGLYQNTMTISEEARGQEWLEGMVDLVPPEEFVEHVMTVLNEGTYLDKVESFKAKFKSQPMTSFMENLVTELKILLS